MPIMIEDQRNVVCRSIAEIGPTVGESSGMKSVISEFEIVANPQQKIEIDMMLPANHKHNLPPDISTCTIAMRCYNWLAVLKSVNPSFTRAYIVFSPSRTHTRGLRIISAVPQKTVEVVTLNLLEVLLIRLVIPLRISNLLEKIVFPVEYVVPDTS